jgi:prepilin peptidase CpaA
VVLCLTATAAFTDVRTGHIPNWLTLPAILLAPLAHFALAGVPGAAFSLAGIVVCGLIPLIMFFRGAMGGGDVKIFAAIGAVVGPGLALEVQLLTFLVATLFSLGLLAYRGTLLRTLANVVLIAVRPLLPEARRKEISPELTSTLRLGLAIFVGTLVAVIASRSGGLL